MSLDTRYVAPGVPLVTRKFFDNSGGVFEKDRPGLVSREEDLLIVRENRSLWDFTNYFADQLSRNPGGKPISNINDKYSLGLLGVASLTHNVLMDSIPTQFEDSGLPRVSKDIIEKIKTRIRKGRQSYRSEKGCSCLVCYCNHAEIGRFKRENPELFNFLGGCAKKIKDEPIQSWMNYEGICSSGAIAVYEILAEQNKVYILEDKIKLE